MRTNNKVPLKLILLSGLLVGSLDILAAFVNYYIATGKGPEGVLKYIASGVFGMEAFNGNTGMLGWGLLFHFLIAFSFTFFYFWVYRNLNFASAHPVVFAILYAIFMWAVTTKVVIPLSNVPKVGSTGLPVWRVVKAITILIFMICLPLTIIARTYFRPGTQRRQDIASRAQH